MSNQKHKGPSIFRPTATPHLTLEIFEGPLDLLLYLIRKNEYDIFDIPIASVTQQYLEYLDILKELNLDVAGDFLVMAATLMKVKSMMLLPRTASLEEEDGEDPRAALIRQLLEYQRYKEAADQFSEREMLGRDVFARDFASPELSKVENEDRSYLEVDVYELIEALRNVIKRLPEDQVHMVRMEPYSVRERMQQLTEILKGVESITFESLFDDAREKIEVVTTFLALLEMIRMQLVSIYQAQNKGTIRIKSLIRDEQESMQEGEPT